MADPMTPDAAKPHPCPVCGYIESMHVPKGGTVCPPVAGRVRGEGVYVER